MTKQFDQQRNRGRTELPDDFKHVLMEVFIVTGEESSQQRQRPLRPLDQDGFGGCADLWVAGLQAICPVIDQRGVTGKTRRRRRQRRLGQRDRLAEASRKDDCENAFLCG